MHQQSETPVRIAFCITDLDPGGAEKSLVQLVLGLDRTRWVSTVYCLGPEAELAGTLREHGIAVHCYGAKSRASLGVFSWLTHQLREFRPEVLQCFLFHGNFVGRIAGKRAKVPHIVAGHRVAERQHRWHLWLERWTRRWVDHHVCVSQGVADHLERCAGVLPQQMTVIPNGVTVLEKAEPPISLFDEFGIPEASPVVLAAGRLHPQKGFLVLLQAFKRVLETVPESRLLILGEGPQREVLERTVCELGVAREVCLAGRSLRILSVMRRSTVFAMTSVWEGMPNVVLEAMASRLPVVSMDVEGIRELIPDDTCGFVVTQGDIKGFADAVTAVLQDSGLRKKLSANALGLVQKQFTWKRMVHNYVQLYESLVN